MRIALFGGTFDPVHNAHLKIAQEAQNAAKLDKVIFVPSGNPPHKEKVYADKFHRLNMVKLAVLDYENFEVSSYEVDKKTYSYTYETLTHFKKLYPSDELFFIIGDDAYKKINEWYQWEKLFSLCEFLVFTRNNEKIDPPAKYFKITPMDVSSTEIRKKLCKKEYCGLQIPKRVLEYIKEHHLYEEV
ncbi:MAG: nicotinate-nucleotide adenylyltransferase [Clostridiaceae bacterium]|nr:nicotinate-nucleotide adenylyltransferase [Clostridiaceae bacterium]